MSTNEPNKNKEEKPPVEEVINHWLKQLTKDQANAKIKREATGAIAAFTSIVKSPS